MLPLARQLWHFIVKTGFLRCLPSMKVPSRLAQRRGPFLEPVLERVLGSGFRRAAAGRSGVWNLCIECFKCLTYKQSWQLWPQGKRWLLEGKAELEQERAEAAGWKGRCLWAGVAERGAHFQKGWLPVNLYMCMRACVCVCVCVWVGVGGSLSDSWLKRRPGAP